MIPCAEIKCEAYLHGANVVITGIFNLGNRCAVQLGRSGTRALNFKYIVFLEFKSVSHRKMMLIFPPLFEIIIL